MVNDITNANNEPIVEEESGNENIVIRIPFDPNKIKVSTKPYTLGQIMEDLVDGIINLNTEFQRLPDLWDNRKKSRFIESLLLKLPIPAFYFSEKAENNWEVVDGLQRISTLRSYVMLQNMELQDLEFLKEFNRYKYSQLPNTLQRRIRTFPITLYLIEKGTPDDVKYNIFKRINQGGLVLTPQEIRHAINQGRPAELVADLVRSAPTVNDDGNIDIRHNADGSLTVLTATSSGIAFAQATDHKIGTTRMEDRDFATRFIAFYLIPYQEYEPDLDTFLNRGMAKINELTIDQIEQLKHAFTRAMRAAYLIFDNDAFRKRFNPDDGRKPINKALFEVLSTNFAKLNDRELQTLQERADLLKAKLMFLHNSPDGKFLRSISQGTAQKETVDQRFRDIESIIQETLENA
jgi:hypothetical protein